MFTTNYPDKKKKKKKKKKRISSVLPYLVKTQYLQILNITSIKRAVSGQSTPMVKCCIFDMVDTDLNYGRALIVC